MLNKVLQYVGCKLHMSSSLHSTLTHYSLTFCHLVSQETYILQHSSATDTEYV
jgi:hypothetical protein